MPASAGTDKLAYWLLGALLVALMGIISITHSVVMNRFDSMERRLERIENKTMNMPLH